MPNCDLSSGGMNASAKPSIPRIGSTTVKIEETAKFTPVKFADATACSPIGIRNAVAMNAIDNIIAYRMGFNFLWSHLELTKFPFRLLKLVME